MVSFVLDRHRALLEKKEIYEDTLLDNCDMMSGRERPKRYSLGFDCRLASLRTSSIQSKGSILREAVRMGFEYLEHRPNIFGASKRRSEHVLVIRGIFEFVCM